MNMDYFGSHDLDPMLDRLMERHAESEIEHEQWIAQLAEADAEELRKVRRAFA